MALAATLININQSFKYEQKAFYVLKQSYHILYLTFCYNNVFTWCARVVLGDLISSEDKPVNFNVTNLTVLGLHSLKVAEKYDFRILQC